MKMNSHNHINTGDRYSGSKSSLSKSSLLFREVHIGERVCNTAMILDVNEKDISPEQVINDYVSGMY